MFPGLCRPRGVRAFVVPELKIVKQHIYVFHAIGGRHPYGHCAGRSRAGHRPRRVAAFVQPQKGEAYECGIPTRGRSWMQFKVGYYLFAILFLMFDVETVFLFSWAVVVQELGVYGLVSILFFLVVLILGLAYAWRKGALEWK